MRNSWKGVALCVALSLALHGLGAWGLAAMPRPTASKAKPADRTSTVRLHRPAPKEHEDKKEEEEAAKARPFAKTDPDQAEKLPERVDYEGQRNARAASDPDSPGLESDKEAPAMTGEEKDELTTFRQEHQDGDLDKEGKKNAPTPPADPSTAPMPDPTLTPAPQTPGTPSTRQQEADTPHDSETDTVAEKTAESDSTSPSEATEKTEETEPSPLEGIPSILPMPELDPNRIGIPIGKLDMPPPPAPQLIIPRSANVHRDPTLADHAQPGFRTYERRSRSTGRFVVGRNASLNVAATPRGRYEAEIYRRIAYWWYRECDEHRGDIIPGKIVVSIRLNRSGRLVNMDLIQRSGASVIQQSFTFGAIRQASLPPMPPNVQEEVVGDLLEMIFDFNFN